MIRNLKVLGMAFMAACAMSVVASSVASAAPGLFTAQGVPEGVRAGFHGEQAVTDTLTIGSHALTCSVVAYTGEAETAGPSSTNVALNPNYQTCHVITPFFGTRTMTVVSNGCQYTLNATKNTNSSSTGPTQPPVNTPFSADLTFDCPSGNEIRFTVYNTANHNDVGAAVLCEYAIPHQSVNDQIQLTNLFGTPNDILAHVHANVAITNLKPGPICTEKTTAIYEGRTTLRATNTGVLVNAVVS